MESRFQSLCEFVTKKLEATGIPGAALGILHNDVTYSVGLGVTSVDHPLAVTDETLFQIGSITKTFTAMLLLQLADDGKVDLDAPIQTYLPDFKVQDETASTKATVRHLLTHTAGWIGDVFIDTGSGDDAIQRYIEKLADSPQLVPMDEAVSYNNASFSICGGIIEAVTGQTFEEVLRERILSPLSMNDACLYAKNAITKRFAVGHLIGDDSTQRTITVAEPWELPRSLHAAGAISCSVLELLKYAWFQMGDGCDVDGNQLVSPAAWADLHTEQVSINGAYDGVALSWFVGKIGEDLSFITHTGGTNGQSTQLLIVPEAKFAIAIFTNANRGREAIDPAVAKAIELFLDIKQKVPVPQLTSMDELTALCGHYARPHAELELKLEDGQLMLYVTPRGGFPTQDAPVPPAPPPVPCAIYAPDRLIITDGSSKNSRLEIVRTDGGEIGWIRYGMRLHRRLS